MAHASRLLWENLWPASPPTNRSNQIHIFLFSIFCIVYGAFMYCYCCYNNVCGTDSILWAYWAAVVSLFAYTSHSHTPQQISRCINLYAIKVHIVCFLVSFACIKMVKHVVVCVCVCMRTYFCLLILRLAATNVLWSTYNNIILLRSQLLQPAQWISNSNLNDFCKYFSPQIEHHWLNSKKSNSIFQLQFLDDYEFELFCFLRKAWGAFQFEFFIFIEW